jgi:predicted nucleic acid-binding protein
MSKEFINLHAKSSPSDCFYVLDTNVLLPVFGLENDDYKSYVTYFDKIVKSIESGSNKHKIIITSLQISELTNRLLRFNANKAFDKLSAKEKAVHRDHFPTYYKNGFRKSEAFEKEMTKIVSAFEDYEDYFELKEVTSFKEIKTVFHFNPKKLDFNDNYILNTAIEYDAILISHDSDFYDENVRFATYNPSLIKAERVKRDNEIISMIANKK